VVLNYSLGGKKYVEITIEYFLRFLLHISLISFFETLFFFQFVSRDEDTGISATTGFYTDKVISSCVNFNINESSFINSILERFVNSTTIIRDSRDAFEKREFFNNRLNNYSWAYFGGLTGTFLCLVGFIHCKGYKMKWGFIIGENLVFVAMLGIYEFMFFESIIKNYATLSPQEISGMFVSGLQKRCGLLI
jgi:hypothetical protein